MRCGRLALARGHSGEPPDREDPGLLLRFVPEFGRSLELVRAGGLFEPFHFCPLFCPQKKWAGAFSTSPRKNFSGRDWNWCPSVMPLPRRCAACVVAGAPPAAASAPTGLVVRGWCSIQSCKTVCGFYRWPSRKHTWQLIASVRASGDAQDKV